MISILINNETFTPYIFYTSFIRAIALEIRRLEEPETLSLKLFDNGDEQLHDSIYRIDPISIPLLLSLIEQLSKFYKKPIELALHNNLATKETLKFLHRSDFFYLTGQNKNPSFPIGKNILDFNDLYFGDFPITEYRPEHKVRCYSLNDDNLNRLITNYPSDDEKRDFLISKYIYSVREHFQELLFDNEYTNKNVDKYIEILSELIANGVLHSKSNTFALMFVSRFSTKFSISDNGIGFEESLKHKQESIIYKPFEFLGELNKTSVNKISINEKIINNLVIIFETLYYSSIKSRQGLFDLLLTVVIDSNGYFRLHTENAQIIISNRMRPQLVELYDLRTKISNIYETILINNLQDSDYEIELKTLAKSIKLKFISLYHSVLKAYTNDYKYSSVRFFNVKFRGVHIEVEIPNN